MLLLQTNQLFIKKENIQKWSIMQKLPDKATNIKYVEY